ncbi:2863_t:CDS:2 [Cetraspora pellucida]|uniref:2863_t:CDS:1 n=1 Tax=Cetraspora pellucida TaxID=1433469 RepID=A0A9N9IYQ5_9GLOM|nr:2863_t:CDS:2 [Cetraspora pellucida]
MPSTINEFEPISKTNQFEFKFELMNTETFANDENIFLLGDEIAFLSLSNEIASLLLSDEITTLSSGDEIIPLSPASIRDYLKKTSNENNKYQLCTQEFDNQTAISTINQHFQSFYLAEFTKIR